MKLKRNVFLCAVLAIAIAPPAAATEYTTFATLHYTLIAGEPGCSAAGLVSAPPGWMVGDAGAIVVTPSGLVDAWISSWAPISPCSTCS